MNTFLDGFISTLLYSPTRAPTPSQQSKAESVIIAKLGKPAEAPTVNAAAAAARAQAIAKFAAWQIESTPTTAPTTEAPIRNEEQSTQSAKTELAPAIGNSEEQPAMGRISISTSSSVRAAYAEN